jgi:hypothetical protein
MGSYVVVPDAASSLKPTLVVILGGTLSDSNTYLVLANRAAFDGFATISLEYDNKNATVGQVCGAYNFPQAYQQDQCYTQMRGASAFGVDYPYDGADGQAPSYCPFPYTGYSACPDYNNNFAGNHYVGNDTYNFPTDDSVVSRLVNVLDSLVTQSGVTVGNAPQSYWSQFLVDSNNTTNSPYKRPSNGHGAYPNWSQIILVGHSQGGGVAGFIAAHLPVQRLIVLSSPQDNIPGTSGQCPESWISDDPTDGNCPAAWISLTTQYNVSGVGNVTVDPQWPSQYSPVSVSNIWGLRHGQSATTSDESPYGNEAPTNWNAVPGWYSSDFMLDDGACLVAQPSTCSASSSQRRFVIASPDSSALNNHDSTGAAGGYPDGTGSSPYGPAVAYVWDKMLTN